MGKRIVYAAGLVAFTAGMVLALYEVQGWKMPTPVAVTLVVLVGILGTGAALVMIHATWVVSAPYRRGWTVRSPLYNKQRTPTSALEQTSDQKQDSHSDLVRSILEEESYIRLCTLVCQQHAEVTPRYAPHDFIDFRINVLNKTKLHLALTEIEDGSVIRYEGGDLQTPELRKGITDLGFGQDSDLLIRQVITDVIVNAFSLSEPLIFHFEAMRIPIRVVGPPDIKGPESVYLALPATWGVTVPDRWGLD